MKNYPSCPFPIYSLCLILVSLLFVEVSLASTEHEQISPLIVVKTSKSMTQALADLKAAIADNNYVFIRQQSVDNQLTEADAESEDVILVYFCNFNMLNLALKRDPRIGVFLPCKITLIQKAGYVEMVAINPKFISQRMDQYNVNKICDQLVFDYNQILEEALL